jgi:hypothetical protein
MTANRYHPSWSDEAQATFERHIAAHGGFEAWEALRVIEFEPQEVGGFLLALKGLGRTCFSPRRIVAHVKERRVEFVYGSHTDTYANGAVTSQPRDVTVTDGRVLFRGTTFEPWYPEHAAYFFGYAWTNYLSLPFLLPELELVAAQVRGARHSYCVRFPERAHTHSPLQRFIFGSDGLLLRHDYRARLAGPLVFGAHYSWDYTNYRGIRLARRRSARPRIGPFALPLNGIGARLTFLPQT